MCHQKWEIKIFTKFFYLKYSIGDIAAIVNGKLSGPSVAVIDHLLIDSRKIVFPASSLFFALATTHRDGHRFIADAYKKGVRNFIVSQNINENDYPEASFVQVIDTVSAMQQLAAHHRRQFSIPTI